MTETIREKFENMRKESVARGRIERPVVTVVNLTLTDVEIPAEVTTPSQLVRLVDESIREKGFKLEDLCEQFKICYRKGTFDEMKERLGQVVNFTN